MAAPDAGASFSIDLAAAQQPIDDLRDVRNQLDHILRDAYRLGNVEPPSRDPVSRDAATVLSRMANGGPGSLVDALLAGIARVDELINSLVRDQEGYGRTESDSVRTFDGHA